MEWYQFLMLAIGLYVMHRETYKESKEFHGRLCSLEERHKMNIEEIVKNALERK